MRRLTQLLNSEKRILSAWCGISDPHYLEIISDHDFDAVCLDMQHGFFDDCSIQFGISTLISRGKIPLVRIPLERWDVASRVLDFGALAVVAPMINNAADARTFAAACKYVPIGERSFGPRHAASLLGVDTHTYLSEIDSCSLALTMIETREAYTNLDEILAVDGIDGILIGPTDLSMSFRQNRIPDVYGVDTIDVVKDIVARCKQMDKTIVAYSDNVEAANMLDEIGVDIITVGNDATYIAAGISSHIAGLKFR